MSDAVNDDVLCNRVLEHLGAELGDAAKETIDPKCRLGLVARFREDLAGAYKGLSEKSKRLVMEILDVAEEEIRRELALLLSPHPSNVSATAPAVPDPESVLA
ncbi:MAG: hypothetical protein PHS95_02270 [Candidatus Pacebacteria bacterium]|nr:hypothetical protein [Candidatus Paceibacterota bacterium]